MNSSPNFTTWRWRAKQAGLGSCGRWR